MFTPIFSPLNHYEKNLRAAHEKNVREYFSLLANQANINKEENAKTVANYDEKQAEISNLEKTVSSNKAKRNWLIAGCVLFWLATVFIAFNVDVLPALQAMIIAITLGASIFAIVKICKKFNAANQVLENQISLLRAQANEFYTQAQKQVAPLNALFTNEDALHLFEKSFPSIRFDTRFSQERMNELIHGYAFLQNFDNESCVLDTLSGELYAYPFLYEKRRLHQMGTYTYHGSLTIHWTTTETDSQGNRRTVSHSQTLHASLTKPKPYYQTTTSLYFCNDEIPNVCFSRTHAHVDDKSENALERTLKKGERKLEKLQDKALEKDKDFTSLLNTDFEVLFNATNRTDEYEFREMFTPRAQESMLELLLDKENYGDDFNFSKRGKICTVQSEHMQFDQTISPFAYDYYSHDFKQIERNFLFKNEEFFRAVYFDFAPILLIPPYQKPLYRSEPLLGNTPHDYAFESLAYRLADALAPENAATPSVYKTELLSKEKGESLVQVSAFAYRTEPRVSYISKYGDDGHWHNVPVEWQEYIPISKTGFMRVGLCENKENAPTHSLYYRGYYAYIPQ